MVSRLFKQFDAVVACPPAAREAYANLIKNKTLASSTLLAQPIQVIRNGCAINVQTKPAQEPKERLRKSWGVRKEDFVVGHVGRMTLDKGGVIKIKRPSKSA